LFEIELGGGVGATVAADAVFGDERAHGLLELVIEGWSGGAGDGQGGED
jgi:hypothetical protein